MKKQDTIKDLFGLTQIEIANLLNISRARYSMFESGKRSLPFDAKLLLSKMFEHLKEIDVQQHKELPHAVPQETEAKIVIHQLLKENEFQLERISRNKAELERKYESHVKALQLVHALDSEQDFKIGKTSCFLEKITTTAKKGLEYNGLAKQVKLRVKLATLEYERELLKAELQKLM